METLVFLAAVVVVGLVIAWRNGAFRQGEHSDQLRRRSWQGSEVHGSARTSFSDARPGWSERHNRPSSRD
jgi:hypothetical protein